MKIDPVHTSYRDILDAAQRPPKWWMHGIPRFSDFRPEDFSVYSKEVALVETKCQACGTRFEVATAGILRPKIAFEYSTGIGDPPNACEPPGCGGAHMGAEEIRVLQFWIKDGVRDWRRDGSWERKLLEYDGPEPFNPVAAPFYRVGELDRDAWQAAKKAGDVATMRRMLRTVGCELVDDVVAMLEYERKELEARLELNQRLQNKST